MASSLGYVLMNWTSEFVRHSKEKKKKKAAKILSKAINDAVQTEELTCLECLNFADLLSRLESHLRKLEVEKRDVQEKLHHSKNSLALTMERENMLRGEHEKLLLEEAQVRYELNQLQKDLTSKLSERDEAHSERIKLMEQLLEEKGCEWARRNEELQRELRQALRSSLYDTEREAASVNTLEQEISSLHSVIELRSLENRDLRSLNNELVCRLERQNWLESELANARMRLDEMAVVLQNKMTSERELLELSETLQQQLVQSRDELMQFKRELENRQYLYQQNQKNRRRISDKNYDEIAQLKQQQVDAKRTPHRNQHQQASYGGREDSTVVLDIREKTESVAWMVQLPVTATPDKNNRERR